MASVPIICECCQQRISPSTSPVDVVGQIWCKPCADKRITTDNSSSIVEDAVNIYYKSMNLDLEKAKWMLSYRPNEGKDSRYEYYLWWNTKYGQEACAIEILPAAIWKFWKLITTVTPSAWRYEIGGVHDSWKQNWDWIDSNCSPK